MTSPKYTLTLQKIKLSTGPSYTLTLAYCDDALVIANINEINEAKHSLHGGLKNVGLQVRENKCRTMNPNDKNDPAFFSLGSWKGGWENVVSKVTEDYNEFMSTISILKRVAKIDPSLSFILFKVTFCAKVHSYLTRNAFTGEQLDKINDESLDFIHSMLHLPYTVGWSTLMKPPTDGGLALRPFTNSLEECEAKICKIVCPGTQQTQARLAKDGLAIYYSRIGRVSI